MELKEGTVKHLQEYIEHKITERGFADETTHERLLLLTEEVGELVKACRKITGMHTDQSREILHTAGEEIVDVINMVFAVAARLGIDVENEFIEKNKKIYHRRYGRSG